MATGGSSDGANISVCTSTCAICLEKYCRPKMLACHHTFCQQCLQDLVGTSSSFPCPSCRKITILPPGGVSALQAYFFIEDDTDTNSSSPCPRLCDICTDQKEATHTCLQCHQRYCLPCRTVHDSIPSCRSHTVTSLEDVEQTSSRVRSGPSHTARQKQTQNTCPKHPNQLLLLHCNKCQADICMQCKVTQHEGHPTEDVLDIQVGVVEPTEPTPCVQESVTEEGGDSTGTSQKSPSASSCATIKVKKAPREISFSDPLESFVVNIWPSSRGRVWIRFWSDHLRLFDAHGHILVDRGGIVEYRRIVNMDDENVLLFSRNRPDGLMISSDGQEKSVSVGFDTNIFEITSGVQCGHHYITRGGTVHYGKIALSGDQVTYSQDRVVFNETPKNYRLQHVSADEQYFAFYAGIAVKVYTRTDLGLPQLSFSYNTEHGVWSACFCKIGERELLLVTVMRENKVRVVDHKDGGRFICFLDTGTVDLVSPCYLSTDYDNHVWIRCMGKGVVVVHLSADCHCEDFSVCSLPTESGRENLTHNVNG